MKYIIGIFLTGIVLYNAVYFRPLDERLAEDTAISFDAKTFVEGIWAKELLGVYHSAIDLPVLLNRLRQDPDATFAEEAQALGIGNIGYFKVKGMGTVADVQENQVLLQVEGQTVEIETEFIFGNAVRDASGLIRINDYDETADFNSISESINDKIRAEVIPSFKAKVKTGDQLRFEGALELNKAHLNLDQLEIIPVSLQIID